VRAGAVAVKSDGFALLVAFFVTACFFAAMDGHHRAEARDSENTCRAKDKHIERLETVLRIRTAELEVNRGMLRAANKKLEKCSSPSE
jgi:hypothetical protein